MSGAALALALPVALALAAPQEAPVELAAQLKRTLDAYGGEAALRKIAGVRETGKVASTMRSGAEGKMVRTFSRPDRLRVEIAYPGEEAEVRVLDGQRGWRRGAAVQGPPLWAMVMQAARLSLPLLLAEKKDQLKDLGLVERDGQKLRALEVPIATHMTVTAYIDPATGRVLHSTGRIATPQSALEFSSSYGDFRKVNGVLVAFTERTVAMGQHTGDTTLERVEHLTALPPETFAP